jgi:hypothetical protein
MRAVLLLAGALLLAGLTGLAYAALDPAGAGDLWRDIRVYVLMLGGALGVLGTMAAVMVATRWRNRRRRSYGRYYLVLSQADEATTETVASAYETLVQTVRVSTLTRVTQGQPYWALESWFVPSKTPGETGLVRLMLLCEDGALPSILSALRQAYPDITVGQVPGQPGVPQRIDTVRFTPGHVLRVSKQRHYTRPLVSGTDGSSSDGRSTLAAVIRQQISLNRISCVRWCVLPAGDWVDNATVTRLQDAGRPRAIGPQVLRADPATSTDINESMKLSGGAMSHLELQAAVEQGTVTSPRTGKSRPETFTEMTEATRQLLGPAMSRRASNVLTHRYMWVRQRLYAKRWATAEPPLWPEPNGSTLVSPRELGALMELPSLGSEHSLPVQRSTVPQLNAPAGLARARVVDIPLPPPTLAGPPPGVRRGAAADVDVDVEVVDAELVDEPPTTTTF